MKRVKARSNDPISTALRKFGKSITSGSEAVGEGVYNTLKNIGAGKRKKPSHKTRTPPGKRMKIGK